MQNKLLGFIFFLSSSLGYAVTMSGTGDITGDYQNLTLTIEVSQLSVGDPSIKPNAQQADLLQNLSLYMANSPNSPIQTKVTTTVDSNFNSYFYWPQASSSATIVTDTPSTQKITYKVQIFPNTIPNPKTLKDSDVGPSGTITVNAVFNKYDPTKQTYSSGAGQALTHATITITKIYSSPNGVPGDFNVSPDHKSLDLKWTTGDVSYVPATTPPIKRTPASVLVMVFGGPGPVDLPASVASSTADPEQTLCKFDKSGGENCIKCPDNDPKNGIYVSINSSQPDNKDVTLFTVQPNGSAASPGEYSVPNLIPDKEYVVVLQYAQGVQRSKCLIGKPIETETLTELNDPDNKQGDAKMGDPRCFIVSAAFGSPFDRHVDIFRWARDRFLNSFSLGRSFVDFYYEHSQPFADAIRNSPKLKAVVRSFLTPVAFLLYKLRAQDEGSSPNPTLQRLEGESRGVGKSS